MFKFRWFQVPSPLRSIKWLYQKEARNHSVIFFFNEFVKCQILRKVDLKKTTFFDQTCLTRIYNSKNNFAARYVPHTSKLSFSDLLKYFRRKWRKKIFQGQKITFPNEANNYSERYFYSRNLKPGKNWGKALIFMETFFLFKPVKWQILPKTVFAPLNEPHSNKLCFLVFWSIYAGNWPKILLSKV